MTPQHREAFENLCAEYEDIFSKDSADLGKNTSPKDGYTNWGTARLLLKDHIP